MATPEETNVQIAKKKKSPRKKPITLLGRRSIYDERHHPNTAMMLKATGYTDEECALVIGISRDTLYKWAKKYPAFSDALKMTSAQANGQVKASLFKRAIGFEVEETKTSISKKADGSQDTKVEKTKKYIVPDTTACIFWLKNKCEDEFKDVMDQRHSGGVALGEDSDARNIKEILTRDPEAKEAVRAAFTKLYPGSGN